MSNATHNALLTTTAVISAAYAIVFLVAPIQANDLFGVTVDFTSIWFVRLLGTAGLGFAAIAFFARRVTDMGARRALDAGFLVAWTTTLGILMWAQYLQVMNPLGWIHVGINASLAVAYFYFLAGEDRYETYVDDGHPA